MSNVTVKKQRRDPWTDPDPQPEDFEEWFANPENEWVTVTVPANSAAVVLIPDGVSVEEWAKRKATARARGERLPDQIAAEEELVARRAVEEKDWSPEQKAEREVERQAACEALEQLRR